MKPKHTTRHAHPSARHQLETQNSKPETHPHADSAAQQNALKSFLQPATPDSELETRNPKLETSHPQLETRNSKLETQSPPPWSADLAALESKHHAALTQLATQHQTTLAALETRLAAAEHATANLSGQLRELR